MHCYDGRVSPLLYRQVLKIAFNGFLNTCLKAYNKPWKKTTNI